MNNFHISIPVSGLIKREDYRYEIVGLGGNWPAIATPMSGLFTASSKTASINTSISFLPTTGSVHNQNVLPYNLSSCGFEDEEIFTNVVARVIGLSDNCVTLSSTELVKCNNCLPNIDIVISPEQTILTDKSTVDFTTAFNGLETHSIYNYSIKSIGSNWPAYMITPTGGSFVANNDSYTLRHKLKFCSNSGCCNGSNILNFTPPLFNDKNNIYINLELSISPDACNNEKIFSNNVLVHCKNCLPKPRVDFPSKISLTSNTGNIINLNTIAYDLSPGKSYNYLFECEDSNWPTILKPISGTFLMPESTNETAQQTISTQLMFCYPSGNCPSGTQNLLPYSLDTLAEKDFNQKKLYTNLKLKLTSECGEIIASKQGIIECDDCLPCIKYASALFSGSPLIELPSGCCQGQKFLSVNINNAIPGDRYTYSFSSTPSTGTVFLVFSPSTGEIYFGSGGVGKVNTIMSTNLTDYAQTLLTFELIHSNTNIKTYDSIGLVCRTDSCDS